MTYDEVFHIGPAWVPYKGRMYRFEGSPMGASGWIELARVVRNRENWQVYLTDRITGNWYTAGVGFKEADEAKRYAEAVLRIEWSAI